MISENAMALIRRGDLQSARQQAERQLAAAPDDKLALETLIRCDLLNGELQSAYQLLQQWLQLQPNAAVALTLLGDLYSRGGRIQQAIQAYQRALQVTADSMAALNGITLALISSQQLEQAQQYWQQAYALAPDDAEVQRNRSLLNRCQAPRWHFPMVNDSRRNESLAAAIDKAVKRIIARKADGSCNVLDIGAGSGLLSMFAARAGATSIIACESNPAMATIARQIVADNGLQQQISIIAKPSSALVVGEDLPQRVDLILAEVFDSVVIGEGAIPTFEHALRELAQPDCVTIPCRADIMAAMVSSEALWHEAAVDSVSGFDLAALNQFTPGMIGLESNRLPLQAVSEPQPLMSFDFSMSARPTPWCSQSFLNCKQAATVHAIVYWMRLWLDDDIVLDNRPDLGDGKHAGFIEHWGPMANILSPAISLDRGASLEIETHHNRRQVTLLVRDPATGKLLA